MSKKSCKSLLKEKSLIITIVSAIFAGGIAYGQIRDNTEDISTVKVELKSSVKELKSGMNKIFDYMLKADRDRCYQQKLTSKGEEYAEKIKSENK